MSGHVYVTRNSDGDWDVIVNGRILGGPYDTEEQAREAAMDFARGVDAVREAEES